MIEVRDCHKASYNSIFHASEMNYRPGIRVPIRQYFTNDAIFSAVRPGGKMGVHFSVGGVMRQPLLLLLKGMKYESIANARIDV